MELTPVKENRPQCTWQGACDHDAELTNPQQPRGRSRASSRRVQTQPGPYIAAPQSLAVAMKRKHDPGWKLKAGSHQLSPLIVGDKILLERTPEQHIYICATLTFKIIHQPILLLKVKHQKCTLLQGHELCVGIISHQLAAPHFDGSLVSLGPSCAVAAPFPAKGHSKDSTPCLLMRSPSGDSVPQIIL